MVVLPLFSIFAVVVVLALVEVSLSPELSPCPKFTFTLSMTVNNTITNH